VTTVDAGASALAQVQAYCGWHIAPVVDETLTLDGTGTSALLLPSLHVVSIDSVSECGTELDPETYSWSEAGLIRRGTQLWVSYGYDQPRWTNAFRAIEVTLSHGYEEMPAEVQGVIDALSARMTTTAPVGVTQKQVGPFVESYAADPGSVTGAERHLLDLYRVPWRP
jgi:hypothetical protein